MKKVRERLTELLQKDYGRGYEFVVGGLAFASALLMSVPFAVPMTVAVLFQPKRWRRIVLATALCSAAGSACLLWAMHHGGWEVLSRWQPGWVSGGNWTSFDRWMERYGNLALFAVMTLPIPESPALAFLSRNPEPLATVFLLAFVGKILKFSAYGYAAMRFRSRKNLPPRQ